MQLVGAVGAVHVAVAAPLGQDAELGVGALELALAARRVAIGLVAPVVAVELAVAAQRAADAPAVPAPELGLAAVARSAAALVRTVAAIVIVIAAPSSRDTLVIITLYKKNTMLLP